MGLPQDRMGLETVEKAQKVLEDVMKDSDVSNIGSITLIGSTVSKDKRDFGDFDILVMPSKEARLGDFLRQYIDLWFNYAEELEKEGYIPSYFGYSNQEVLANHFAKKAGKKPVPIHLILSYSLGNLQNYGPVGFYDRLKSGETPKKHIYGSFDQSKKEKTRAVNSEGIQKLNQNIGPVLNPNYPREIRIKTSRYIISYLSNYHSDLIKEDNDIGPEDLEKNWKTVFSQFISELEL